MQRRRSDVRTQCKAGLFLSLELDLPEAGHTEIIVFTPPRLLWRVGSKRRNNFLNLDSGPIISKIGGGVSDTEITVMEGVAGCVVGTTAARVH